jgi:hypothetical protein
MRFCLRLEYNVHTGWYAHSVRPYDYFLRQFGFDDFGVFVPDVGLHAD